MKKMKKNDIIETDILIIGCGISGSSAALEAAESGLRVIVISKYDQLEESNTYYAQGGIVSLGRDDNPELLMNDIMETGDDINNPDAVKVLSTEGKKLVDTILIWRHRIKHGKEAKVNAGLHKYSRYAYIWWVLAFITGAALVLFK